MKVLNRDVTRYLRRVPFTGHYFWYFIRCFILFKHPLRFLHAYLTATSLPGNMVEFRNGLTLRLSGHPHDPITVFLVFVRRDYGVIQPDSTVLDIGANIGCFALYAASMGARRVLAFEPNSESFQLLLQNIRANHFERTVLPYQFAVTDRQGETVRLPRGSSIYNAIVEDESRTDCETVKTTSLAAIAKEFGPSEMLKLDCEGAEYDILLTTDGVALDGVAAIRMEYHEGRWLEFETHLASFGFVRRRLMRESETSGNIWLERCQRELTARAEQPLDRSKRAG